MPNPEELLAQSLAKFRTANRIDGTRASYRKDNPTEYAKVTAYLDGGARPSGVASDMGLGLMLEEDARRALEVMPPPVAGSPYFVPDYSQGTFKYPVWSTLFSYTPPGYLDCGYYGQPARTQTPDGRCAIVNAPDGTGAKVARFETRDADPAWPNTTNQKAEVRSVPEVTLMGEGDERWVSISLWLPYSASGEQFNWPTSGPDTFFTIHDIKAADESEVARISLQWYGATRWATLRNAAGPVYGNCFRLLNDDGTRYLPNYNRWISLVYGVKFQPNSSGWVEAWVDGVNVIPRVSATTMRPGMTAGHYVKYGLYKNQGGVMPSGRSVIYYKPLLIDDTRPF